VCNRRAGPAANAGKGGWAHSPQAVDLLTTMKVSSSRAIIQMKVAIKSGRPDCRLASEARWPTPEVRGILFPLPSFKRSPPAGKLSEYDSRAWYWRGSPVARFGIASY